MTRHILTAAALGLALSGCAASDRALERAAERVLGPACGPESRALRAEGALDIVRRHRPAATGERLDTALALLERLPAAAGDLAELRRALAATCAFENKS